MRTCSSPSLPLALPRRSSSSSSPTLPSCTPNLGVPSLHFAIPSFYSTYCFSFNSSALLRISSGLIVCRYAGLQGVNAKFRTILFSVSSHIVVCPFVLIYTSMPIRTDLRLCYTCNIYISRFNEISLFECAYLQIPMSVMKLDNVQYES